MRCKHILDTRSVIENRQAFLSPRFVLLVVPDAVLFGNVRYKLECAHSRFSLCRTNVQSFAEENEKLAIRVVIKFAIEHER